jgi:hypothetical protein
MVFYARAPWGGFGGPLEGEAYCRTEPVVERAVCTVVCTLRAGRRLYRAQNRPEGLRSCPSRQPHTFALF